VIAHGADETGRREILSIDVGGAETEAFWTDFLRGLVKRGLVGVQLAISDAHRAAGVATVGSPARCDAGLCAADSGCGRRGQGQAVGYWPVGISRLLALGAAQS
jgi:hypothetical protein